MSAKKLKNRDIEGKGSLIQLVNILFIRFYFAKTCQGYFPRYAKGKFQLLSDHLKVEFYYILILMTYSRKRLVQFLPLVLSIWMLSTCLIKIIKVKSSHLY